MAKTITLTVPEIGDTLRNGATLLAIRPNPRWGPQGFFVLCDFCGEYVTWQLNAEETDGGTFSGNYFNDDIDAARDDFRTR